MIQSFKSRRRSGKSRFSQISIGKILLLLVLLILLVSVVRMTIIMNKKLELVTDRKNVATVELAEIEQLASDLEKQAEQLYSEEGIKKMLRERYGLVGKNEGFILLTDEHPGEIDSEQTGDWWQLWQ